MKKCTLCEKKLSFWNSGTLAGVCSACEQRMSQRAATVARQERELATRRAHEAHELVIRRDQELLVGWNMLLNAGQLPRVAVPLRLSPGEECHFCRKSLYVANQVTGYEYTEISIGDFTTGDGRPVVREERAHGLLVITNCAVLFIGSDGLFNLCFELPRIFNVGVTKQAFGIGLIAKGTSELLATFFFDSEIERDLAVLVMHQLVGPVNL